MLTLHLHGGHQTPPYDGYPETTFEPGRSFVYDYPNNQDPTTLWYHDHAMDHTRGHVLMGLAGFYLVDDPERDAKLGLPTGAFDVPVMFQRVPAELIDQPDVDKPVWTVNNALGPYMKVTNRPYRFRFLNANDENPLSLFTTTRKDDPKSLAPQAFLQQVGTDGGLMNTVALGAKGGPSTQVRLFPAERADVVIDFSKVREPTTFYLQAETGPAFTGDDSFPPDPTVQTPQPLIEFRVDPTISQPQGFARRAATCDRTTRSRSSASTARAAGSSSSTSTTSGRRRSPRSTGSSSTTSAPTPIRSSARRRSGGSSTRPTATTRSTSTTSSSRSSRAPTRTATRSSSNPATGGRATSHGRTSSSCRRSAR